MKGLGRWLKWAIREAKLKVYHDLYTKLASKYGEKNICKDEREKRTVIKASASDIY